jgi:hypothetical protein
MDFQLFDAVKGCYFANIDGSHFNHITFENGLEKIAERLKKMHGASRFLPLIKLGIGL